MFVRQLSVEKLVEAIQQIIRDKKYQESAANYRRELIKNDFEENFMNAINEIFENGKKTD